MKQITLHMTQPAAGTGLARGRASAYRNVLACVTGITGTRNNTGATWFSIARKPMSVPTFHDRWPLCSTT